MKFGPVPIDAAEGAILAHSMRIAAGRRLRKGVTLTVDDLAELRRTGVRTVTVALLEQGDVHEDRAAERVAAAVCGDGLRCAPAATGRVNLYATAPGIVAIDRGAIDALNKIDPMVTIATVREWGRVTSDGLVATVKIISYAVSDEVLSRVELVAEGALSLRRPQRQRVDLIETGPAPSRKAAAAIGGRLERIGVELLTHRATPHEAGAISTAMREAEGDLLLLLTETATSDANDVGPEALRAAGGHLTRFGMPVDPGNLLFLGELQQRPVIGLPGCARSPALNGADWVLERILCGVPVTGDDIAAMGVGGLLKDIPERRAPREAPEKR